MEEQKTATPVKDSVIKKTTKMSIAISQGFTCHNCQIQTVTYDGTAPQKCLGCGAGYPQLTWKDRISTTTTVETMQL